MSTLDRRVARIDWLARVLIERLLDTLVADCASSARLSAKFLESSGDLPEAVLQRKFVEGAYFLLHGYPIASTCSPASLETVSRNGKSTGGGRIIGEWET